MIPNQKEVREDEQKNHGLPALQIPFHLCLIYGRKWNLLPLL